MKNDKKILEKMKEIWERADYYVGYVGQANPDAYCDRLVEEVIVKAKELEKLHKGNFNK